MNLQVIESKNACVRCHEKRIACRGGIPCSNCLKNGLSSDCIKIQDKRKDMKIIKKQKKLERENKKGDFYFKDIYHIQNIDLGLKKLDEKKFLNCQFMTTCDGICYNMTTELKQLLKIPFECNRISIYKFIKEEKIKIYLFTKQTFYDTIEIYDLENKEIKVFLSLSCIYQDMSKTPTFLGYITKI
jgi:hypothetical protein